MEVDLFKAKFRIKTVVDGWNNELSVQQAAENGVVDVQTCQYVNKKTGERCSIMEAIQRGWVVQLTPMERIMELRQGAEARAARRMSSFARVTTTPATTRTAEDVPQRSSTGGRVGRSQSLREPGAAASRYRPKPQASVVGCFYGLISFNVKLRTIKYAITSAVDTKTGEQLDFQRAKSRQIIDTTTQLFTDTKESSAIHFAQAIEHNLIQIETKSETVSESEELEHFVVYGVMDLLEQRRITFKDALETFVLVREPPIYRDTLHHVDMDLYDAIEQRLVVAKPLGDGSISLYDRMISEDNRLEADKEKRLYEYEGPN